MRALLLSALLALCLAALAFSARVRGAPAEGPLLASPAGPATERGEGPLPGSGATPSARLAIEPELQAEVPTPEPAALSPAGVPGAAPDRSDERTPRQLHAELARALGWESDGWRAETLRDWIERRARAERAWIARLQGSPASEAQILAFNREVERLSEELTVSFGRRDAVSLGGRLALRRAASGSGALVRVTLDGEPIPETPDD